LQEKPTNSYMLPRTSQYLVGLISLDEKCRSRVPIDSAILQIASAAAMAGQRNCAPRHGFVI
jgi:hypothetical protein